MNHITKVKLIKNLSEEELRRGIKLEGSWHMKYKDSAYIYVGGFPYEMSEGDLVIVFSQYGEIVDCRIVRDKETGKSKGFGFIAYEDQRSTILAVDNLNGSKIYDRTLRVDHVDQFKIPREYFKIIDDENLTEKEIYRPTGPDGKGWGEFRELTQEDILKFEEMERERERKANKQNIKFNRNGFMLDADDVWEKEFENMINEHKYMDTKEFEGILNKKQRKKMKKEKKKSRKKEKKEKKEKIREEELKKIFETYGIQNIKEKGPNISYLEEKKNEKIKQDDFI